MSDDLAKFRDAFKSVTIEAFQFCFAVRAREFQVEAIEKLQSLAHDAKVVKSNLIAQELEDEANEMLCYEELIGAVSDELKMWIHLKDDDAARAWDAVAAAESHYRVALRAHDIAIELRAKQNMDRILLLQKCLFPAQVFVSAGSKGGTDICSICENDYGSCDHLVGLPYMGQLCIIRVEDAHLTEISIVDEPALKTARAHSFIFDGVTRNVMTWRPETVAPLDIGDS